MKLEKMLEILVEDAAAVEINDKRKLVDLQENLLKIEIWSNILYSFIILNRHCFERQWKNRRLCQPTGSNLEGCDSCMTAYTTDLTNKHQYKRGRPAFTRGGPSALYYKNITRNRTQKMAKIHPNLHATHVSDN